MGSRTYDFLADSFLFRDSLLDECYASVPEQELVKELRKYREFVLANEDALLSEVAHGNSTLNVFSGERVNLPMLKACALYVHQYIIDDPLFDQ